MPPKNNYPVILSVKETFIIICLAGCLFLAITGAWNYTKNSLLLKREKEKARGFDQTGFNGDVVVTSELQEKKLWAGVMGVAGAAGLFLFIYKSTRNKKINSLISNYKKSKQA